jgi:hypothetical protein
VNFNFIILADSSGKLKSIKSVPMKNRLLSVLALAAILLLNACKDDEKKLPANVIQDADGVTIELTWSTDGTSTQALIDADLDLFIFDSNEDPVDDSSSEDDFEELDLDEDEDDDEYTISAGLFHNDSDKDIDFVITVSGGDKEIETEGSFSGSASDFTLTEVITITKKGNKYTVEEN